MCAENCKNLCQATIQCAKEKYECDAKSIVTDNAKNMEKMRKELEDDDPSLIVFGCLSHWLNLLGQDITPSGVLKHIIEIQKFFRNHHLPAAWLKECEGSIKPQLPCDTRWNSQLACLSSYLNNRPHYMKIAEIHEDLDSTIVRKIMDYNLFCQARDLVKQLTPVSHAINRAQSDTTTIADSLDICVGLLSNPDLEPHKSSVEKRVKQALLPCHFAAYKIHPKYKGEGLSNDQNEMACNWILKRNPDFMGTTLAFSAKRAPFPSSHL